MNIPLFLLFQLERQSEDLLTEVRELEGQLADHNLALDKHRSHTDPALIQDHQRQLHEQNEQEKQYVDEARVFVLFKINL